MSAVRANWTSWIGYAAALWLLGYCGLGLWWAAGGAGFPFGAGHDRASVESALADLTPGAAPVIAGLGLAGALAALAMARSRNATRGPLRALLLGFAAVLCVILFMVVPDRRVLMGVGYAPVAAVSLLFGGMDVNYFEVAWPWPVLNQLNCILGGFLVLGTAMAYLRRTKPACANCGRGADQPAGWTTPESAARWGRWAVYVAAIVPVMYAVTRIAWALGIPFGITAEFLNSQPKQLWMLGLGLALFAVGGAVLTFGLVHRWGEVFPRWTLWLSGRRVPLALPVGLAGFVSVIVVAGGIPYLRLLLVMGVPEQGWATVAPEWFWPLWGASLAAATLAYYYRVRGQCRRCGRGAARPEDGANRTAPATSGQ